MLYKLVNSAVIHAGMIIFIYFCILLTFYLNTSTSRLFGLKLSITIISFDSKNFFASFGIGLKDVKIDESGLNSLRYAGICLYISFFQYLNSLALHSIIKFILSKVLAVS